jgi:soluble lytic murein transglycosylase-like protein
MIARMRTKLFQFGAVVAAVALVCPAARAAEHVTLSNGFSIDCSRHETVDGQVRLYTSSDSYLDVAADRITKIETVPDAVKPAKDAVKEIPARYANDAVKAIGNAQAKEREAKDREMSAEELHPLLLRAGTAHRIDEDLLASVVKAESAGHTAAVSRAGAEGLMQLMPGTAAQLGVSDVFRPEQNIAGGAAYLDQLLTRYHDDVKLALAAYNAGPEAVDRYHGVPPYAETRAYVRRVIVEFNRRKRAEAQGPAAEAAAAPAEVASK